MKELKEVISDIGEILDSAEMYAKEAVKHKTQYPSLAGVYVERCTIFGGSFNKMRIKK